MRKFILLASTAIVAACSTPGINVKEQWSDSITNFAMVPLYPMREDVYVGDIRIHVLDIGESDTLDSRYLGRLSALGDVYTGVDDALIKKEQSAPDYSDPSFGENTAKLEAQILKEMGAVPEVKTDEDANASTAVAQAAALLAEAKQGVQRWTQPNTTLTPKRLGEDRQIFRLRRAALPRLDAARVTSADAQAFGILKAWNYVIGGSVEDTETVMISLTRLESAELDETQVIKPFYEQVSAATKNDDEEFLHAVCHAAKSWGDPTFEKTAISMVTRVFYARGVQYTYGETFGAALKASLDPLGDVADQAQGGSANGRFARAGRLSLNEEFNAPMAFGVDAVMLDPQAFGLGAKCETINKRFRTSPLKLKKRQSFGN